MIDGSNEKKSCTDKLLKEFNVYDMTVDVVSCWESFSTYSYSLLCPDFFFDRFPSMSIKDFVRLTPDFTILFNDKYGIIFECIRSTSPEEHGLERLVEQLKKYDQPLPFRSNNGFITPNTHDIVLLTEVSSANQIAKRINALLTDKYDFGRSLILMEYFYNSTNAYSRYEFRKNTLIKNRFNDDSLPETCRLEKKIGEEGEFQTIKCYPKHFLDYKVRGVVINDAPPPIYLITYLWNKILYRYLTDDQRKIWKKKNPQTTMEINIKPDELTERINKEFVPNGQVNKSWVKKSLDFLVYSKMAKKDGELYTIYYRNLFWIERFHSLQENGTQEIKEFSELAKILIEKYCDSIQEEKSVKERIKPSSESIKTLDHFINKKSEN